jgi:HPt (histidine-containing phosphotransfer) domain-containing protein
MQTQSCSIDPDVIERFRRLTTPQDPSFFKDMVALFIKDTEKRLASITEALEQNKSDRVAAAAHGLSGGAAIVGAYRLAELCSPLQQLPPMPESDVRRLVGKIREEYAEVRQLLALALKASC